MNFRKCFLFLEIMFKAFVKIDVIEDNFFLCRVRLMMLLKINFYKLASWYIVVADKFFLWRCVNWWRIVLLLSTLLTQWFVVWSFIADFHRKIFVIVNASDKIIWCHCRVMIVTVVLWLSRSCLMLTTLRLWLCYSI